jgi:hypothetical protein
VSDAAGAKLNFYLTTALATASGVCTDGGPQVHRLTFTLKNELDAASAGTLSPSITGIRYVEDGRGPGDQILAVLVYAPPGSTILGATVDGAAVVLQPFHDTDRPVAKIAVLARAGESTVMSIDISMGSPGKRLLEVQTTPGVVPTLQTTEALDCSTVPLAG